MSIATTNPGSQQRRPSPGRCHTSLTQPQRKKKKSDTTLRVAWLRRRDEILVEKNTRTQQGTFVPPSTKFIKSGITPSSTRPSRALLRRRCPRCPHEPYSTLLHRRTRLHPLARRVELSLIEVYVSAKHFERKSPPNIRQDALSLCQCSSDEHYSEASRTVNSRVKTDADTLESCELFSIPCATCIIDKYVRWLDFRAASRIGGGGDGSLYLQGKKTRHLKKALFQGLHYIIFS